MKSGRPAQQGGALLIIITTVLVVVGASVAIKYLKGIHDATRRTQSTQTQQEAVRLALVRFLAVHGRLPCPAEGSLAEGQAGAGIAQPAGASATCTATNPVLPWVTLGIPQETSLDGWGNRFSYRVYQGNTGMTATDGADMSNCHSDAASPGSATAPNYLCPVARTTSAQTFLNATYRPGLSVIDLNGTASSVGFVLISHGATGNGAWTSGGGQLPLPAAGNTAETANTQNGTSYYRQPFSDRTVTADANNHFDDHVVYMSIEAAAQEARRGARAWSAVAPGTPPVVGAMAAVNFTTAVLTANGVTFTGRSTNTDQITLAASPSVSTPLVLSTATGDVVTDNAAGMAIGVCQQAPAPCNNTTAQLANPEYLSFRLTAHTAEKVTIDLQQYGGGESMQLVFKLSGVAVGTPVVVSHPTNPNAVVASTAGKFDEVVLTPLGGSAFYVRSIQFCDAASTCP